jgi:hypothetical protein
MADVTSGSESSFFTPQMVSALVQMGPGLLQAFQGGKQTREAKKMQQQLGPRVNYAIPGSATRALALSEEQARPRTMFGQDQMQYMIDLENAKAFANASKAATSSQDLLGVATQLGERGQENQLTLGMKVAQDYGARQEALGRALANMATYEDKVTADRQADWYERARAAAAMRGAGMQNQMGALQGLTQAAVGFLASDAAKKLFGQNTGVDGGTTPSSYNFTPSSSLPTTFQTTGLFANAPRSTTMAPQANSFNFSSPFGPYESGYQFAPTASDYGPYASGYQMPGSTPTPSSIPSTISMGGTPYAATNPYTTSQATTMNPLSPYATNAGTSTGWSGFGNQFFNF